ncbi:MAG: DUF4339 domain-containing protein [Bacteroidetes bacterium]|nr:DUF4339 domain-containing protein [Bacteroidota bacterium]
MQYYYAKNGQTLGPLAIKELVKFIDRDTMIWCITGSNQEWKPAKDIPEINIALIPLPPLNVQKNNPPPLPSVIQSYSFPPPLNTTTNSLPNSNVNLYIESEKKNKVDNFQAATSGASNISKTFFYVVFGIIGILIIRACH